MDEYGYSSNWWEFEKSDNIAVNSSHECFEEDNSNCSAKKRAQGIALQSRFRRFHGRYHHSQQEQFYARLTGNCVENTLAVIDEARRRDITAQRVCVMSERDYTDEFGLAEHAYDAGFSHHLAQVHIDSNEFFIDPSLWQYGKLTGSPYVGTTLPEEYVWFEDSVSFMNRVGIGPEEYNMKKIAPKI